MLRCFSATTTYLIYVNAALVLDKKLKVQIIFCTWQSHLLAESTRKKEAKTKMHAMNNAKNN